MGQRDRDFGLLGWVSDAQLEKIGMRVISLLSIYVIFIVGCAPTSQRQIIPSLTLDAPILTSTLIPTATRTTTPIPSPTWTPLPIVPTEILQKTILDLIENNNGCEYPCLWGIRPGITDWSTAKAFLDTLSPTYWQPESKENIIVTVPLPDNWSYDFSSGSMNFFINNAIVTSISGFTDDTLASVLSKYGQPEEVWVIYHEYVLTPPYYFYQIAFSYPEKGFAFYFGDESNHYDSHHICPFRRLEAEKLIDGEGKLHILDHSMLGISLWNPAQIRSSEKVISLHNSIIVRNDPFVPLEQISNLDEKSFFEIYKDPNTHQCIEIMGTP